MSTTTESPFSLTIKVGPNNDLLTGRADTADEMLGRIEELRLLAASMQGATQAVTTDATASAIQNLQAAGMNPTVVTESAPMSNAGVETKEDKFGNQYTRGVPGVEACNHGPRIVKNGTNKSGKPYKALVCVNDSPFGNWKDSKCDIAWPAR